MALFGRRKRTDRLDDDLLDEVVADDDRRPEPPEGVPGVDRPWDRAVDGPYDVAEWPGAKGRVDLGALRVPAVQGVQMRLDLEQGTNRVVGATLSVGASQLQLQAFAAPRTLGLWDELRPEIARGLVQAGGAAEAVEGMLGKELRARMPGRAPDGRVAFQPARFIGVDGPRWFLRVVVNGPAATDDEQLRAILPLVRNTIVRRGEEPRPPREVLELTPPKGVMEAAAQQAEARRAAAAQVQAKAAAEQTQVLREADATGVAGVTVGQAGGPAATPGAPGAEPDRGRHRPADQPAPTEAPKPPSNPEFT